MAKYIYPAVFTKEEDGYSILFPDLEGCIAQGGNLQDGIDMARDALCLLLYDMEVSGEPIPEPSNPINIRLDDDSFVTLIDCDTMEYRRFYKAKAVKKTVTIPEWLNEIAEEKNVNFSQTLQNAIKEQLHLEK